MSRPIINKRLIRTILCFQPQNKTRAQATEGHFIAAALSNEGLPSIKVTSAREDGRTKNGNVCTKFSLSSNEPRSNLASQQMACILCDNALASIDSLRKPESKEKILKRPQPTTTSPSTREPRGMIWRFVPSKDRLRTNTDGLQKVGHAPRSVRCSRRDEVRLSGQCTLRRRISFALFATKASIMTEALKGTG